MNLPPLKDIRNPDTPAPAAADETGRSSQTFLMEAIVRNGNAERRAVAQGRDIYAITAPIVVEAALRVVSGLATSSGVVTAGQAFNPLNFLSALAPEHLSFAIEHSLSPAR